MLKFAAVLFVASYAMGASCESLSSLSIPHTTIVAESVAAGAFTPAAPAGGKGGKAKGGGNAFADLPAFCRVQVTSKPSADSDIKIEYWLPVSRMEREFRGQRQRRLERIDHGQHPGDGHAARLRGGHDRHRATTAAAPASPWDIPKK